MPGVGDEGPRLIDLCNGDPDEYATQLDVAKVIDEVHQGFMRLSQAIVSSVRERDETIITAVDDRFDNMNVAIENLVQSIRNALLNHDDAISLSEKRIISLELQYQDLHAKHVKLTEEYRVMKIAIGQVILMMNADKKDLTK